MDETWTNADFDELTFIETSDAVSTLIVKPQLLTSWLRILQTFDRIWGNF